jgi:hypothetical protein
MQTLAAEHRLVRARDFAGVGVPHSWLQVLPHELRRVARGVCSAPVPLMPLEEQGVLEARIKRAFQVAQAVDEDVGASVVAAAGLKLIARCSPRRSAASR